jgi:GNAT superfamily N-acetyltransferase
MEERWRFMGEVDFVPQAMESFVRGIAFTRSMTHLYESVQLQERIWLVRDAPRKSGGYRTAEVAVYEQRPDEVVEIIRRVVTGKYFLCAFAKNASETASLAQEYRRHGYRLMRREPFFVAESALAPRYDGPIRRILDWNDANRVNIAARSKQIRQSDLTSEDAPLRLYAAFDGELPVGWARCIRTHHDCEWVSSVFVQECYRGNGLGRALISTLLAEDTKYGISRSVLLASQAGARLYPHVGYSQIGILLVMAPPKLETAPPA